MRSALKGGGSVTESEDFLSYVDQKRDEAFDRSILKLPIDNLGRKTMEGCSGSNVGCIWERTQYRLGKKKAATWAATLSK